MVKMQCVRRPCHSVTFHSYGDPECMFALDPDTGSLVDNPYRVIYPLLQHPEALNSEPTGTPSPLVEQYVLLRFVCSDGPNPAEWDWSQATDGHDAIISVEPNEHLSVVAASQARYLPADYQHREH